MTAKIALVFVEAPDESKPFPCLTMLQEAYGEEGVFYPAQHVFVAGTSQITALRNFCNAALKAQGIE